MVPIVAGGSARAESCVGIDNDNNKQAITTAKTTTSYAQQWKHQQSIILVVSTRATRPMLSQIHEYLHARLVADSVERTLSVGDGYSFVN